MRPAPPEVYLEEPRRRRIRRRIRSDGTARGGSIIVITLVRVRVKVATMRGTRRGIDGSMRSRRLRHIPVRRVAVAVAVTKYPPYG